MSDRDPELLRRLDAAGVRLDAVVVVGAAGTLDRDGQPLALPAGAAEAVWVSR